MKDRSTGQPRNRALRLLFELDGEQIALRAARSIDTVPPPSHQLPEADGVSGFWVELRGSKEELIYRRILDDAVLAGVEVFDPEGGMRREAAEGIPRVISILLPDVAEAASVVFFSTPTDTDRRPIRGRRTRSARETVRFDLPTIRDATKG